MAVIWQRCRNAMESVALPLVALAWLVYAMSSGPARADGGDSPAPDALSSPGIARSDPQRGDPPGGPAPPPASHQSPRPDKSFDSVPPESPGQPAPPLPQHLRPGEPSRKVNSSFREPGGRADLQELLGEDPLTWSPALPPSEAATLTADELEQLELQAAERHSLNQFLDLDRSSSQLLLHAASAIAQDRSSEAMQLLQSVYEQPADHFLWIGTPPRLTTVRTLADRLFDQLPFEARRLYTTINGPPAEALLAQWHQQQDRVALTQLLLHYPRTDAATEALSELALLAADRGEWLEAARWSRLLAQRVPLGRDRHDWIAWAEALHEHATSSDDVRAAGPIQTVAVFTRPGAEGSHPSPPRAQNLQRWTTPHGSPTGLLIGQGTIPFVEPRWQASFLKLMQQDLEDETTSSSIRTLVGEWESERKEAQAYLAAAGTPLIVNRTVFVRDYDSIRGFDLDTGRCTVRYPLQSSLVSAVQTVEQTKTPEADRNSQSTSLSYEEIFAENSVLNHLTSDGRLLFAVDSTDLVTRRPNIIRTLADEPAEGHLSAAVNRLTAFEIPRSGSEPETWPAWELSGLDSSSAEWSGHFFLGPPLPEGERLYVASERDSQLYMNCVDVASGALLWRQCTALIDLPVAFDSRRARQACTPMLAGGLLLCPTQLGTLVAVNPVTGELDWVYFYADDDVRLHAGRWRYASSRQYSSAAFPSEPVVVEDRIYHLPAQSRSVHCLDLQTGEALWTHPRLNDVYLATVTGRHVVLVGDRTMRFLSRQTGEELRRTSLGLPAGRGLRLESLYLVPQSDGRILAVDLESGRARDDSFDRFLHEFAMRDRNEHQEDSETPFLRPGNLALCGDHIVSVGASGVAVYQMAGALKAELERRLAEDPAPEHRFRAAKVELALGNLNAARLHLEALLREPSPSQLPGRFEQLMREVLYVELANRQRPQETLHKLDQLARTDDQRARYLARRVEADVDSRVLPDLLATADQLAALEPSGPIRLTGSSAHETSPHAQLASVLTRPLHDWDLAARERLGRTVDQRADVAIASDDDRQMEQFLRAFAAWPQADRVRNRLADRVSDSAPQRAELLLLQTARERRPVASADAARKLVRLYREHGRIGEAAAQLGLLREQFGSISLDDETTGREFVDRLIDQDEDLAWEMRKRYGRVEPVYQVEIIEQTCPNGCDHQSCGQSLHSLYHPSRPKIAPPAGADYDLVDGGVSQDDRHVATLRVVNSPDGSGTRQIAIPAQYWHPPELKHPFVGHFFPLGSYDGHGLSLLADPPELWKVRGGTDYSRGEKLKVAVCGPDHCVFQSKRELIAVDPASGEVLWRREHFDPRCGLLANESDGMFGDEDVLVVFDADSIGYRVFEMRTGQLLRRDRLSDEAPESKRMRMPLGRLLFYVAHGDGGQQYRVLDPASGGVLLSENVPSRPMIHLTPEGHLAYIAENRHLRILHPRSLEVLFDSPLPEEVFEKAVSLKVFRQSRRIFVNMTEAVMSYSSSQYTSPTTELRAPCIAVNGPVLVFDEQTSELLWSCDMERRSILFAPHYRLPFVLTCSRKRDGHRPQPVSLLVEALDLERGRMLARHDELSRTTLVQLQYEPEEGHVRLVGFPNSVAIEFGERTPAQVRFDWRERSAEALTKVDYKTPEK